MHPNPMQNALIIISIPQAEGFIVAQRIQNI